MEAQATPETGGDVPRWISYREAERYVGLSRTTLWKLAAEKSIRTAKIGRTVRLDRNSLDEFMESKAS